MRWSALSKTQQQTHVWRSDLNLVAAAALATGGVSGAVADVHGEPTILGIVRCNQHLQEVSQTEVVFAKDVAKKRGIAW